MEFSVNWWEKSCVALRRKASNWWPLNLCRYWIYSKLICLPNKNHLVKHVMCSRRLRTFSGNTTLIWWEGLSLGSWCATWTQDQLWQWWGSPFGIQAYSNWTFDLPRGHIIHRCYVTVGVGAGVAGSGCGQDCTEDAGRDQPCRFVAWNHQRRLLCGRGQVRPAETELGIFRTLDLPEDLKMSVE